MDEISVAVPARAEFLHVLRRVVASVAAKLDFPFDGIEDLCLAVDEACGLLLAGRSARRLETRILPQPGRVEVVASIDSEGPWPPSGVEGTLSWMVLTALSDEVDLDRTDRGPTVRLIKAAGVAGSG